MGAEVFMCEGVGESIGEAFNDAREEALHFHGSGGYTGSIAEKNSFVEISLPDGVDPYRYAEQLIDENDSRISDKWGDAGAILIKTEDSISHKACRVREEERFTQRGKRIWKTKFHVLNSSGDRVATKNSQTEAENEAKRLTLIQNEEMSVQIVKELIGSNSNLVKFSPVREAVTKKGAVKFYLFFGIASS